MANSQKWITIKVRKPLYDKILDALQNNADPTITNISQFADLAIRKQLDKLEANHA